MEAVKQFLAVDRRGTGVAFAGNSQEAAMIKNSPGGLKGQNENSHTILLLLLTKSIDTPWLRKHVENI
jgi:hypothetical protein